METVGVPAPRLLYASKSEYCLAEQDFGENYEF